jgi:hypothetical protein
MLAARHMMPAVSAEQSPPLLSADKQDAFECSAELLKRHIATGQMTLASMHKQSSSQNAI